MATRNPPPHAWPTWFRMTFCTNSGETRGLRAGITRTQLCQLCEMAKQVGRVLGRDESWQELEIYPLRGVYQGGLSQGYGNVT